MPSALKGSGKRRCLHRFLNGEDRTLRPDGRPTRSGKENKECRSVEREKEGNRDGVVCSENDSGKRRSCHAREIFCTTEKKRRGLFRRELKKIPEGVDARTTSSQAATKRGGGEATGRKKSRLTMQ